MSVAAQGGVRSGVEDGIAWKVLLSPLANSLNGYARVPAGHPWSGKDYDDVPAEIHGGLTFSGDGWIGFDTAHAWDWWTESELARVGGRRSPYDYWPKEFDQHEWTVEEIEAETRKLARQVAAATS